jgi:hypothetical protein
MLKLERARSEGLSGLEEVQEKQRNHVPEAVNWLGPIRISEHEHKSSGPIDWDLKDWGIKMMSMTLMIFRKKEGKMRRLGVILLF